MKKSIKSITEGKKGKGLLIAVVIVSVLLIIAVLVTVIIIYVGHRRGKNVSPPSDGNGSSPPATCIGLTDTPACYKCMVAPINRPIDCPDCNQYPNDPTCTTDCTKQPRDPSCPDCTKYSDAPGCGSSPPPSSQTIADNLQKNKGWIVSSTNGGCLNVSTTRTSQGWPNISDGTGINLSVCIPNDPRQVWRMDSADRFVIDDSDKKHCLAIATDKGIPQKSAIMHMWSCDYKGNQVWIPQANPQDPSQFRLVNANNESLCLDSTPGIGYSPILSTCDPTVQGQYWTFQKK